MITQSLLKERFLYDPESGYFYRTKRRVQDERGHFTVRQDCEPERCESIPACDSSGKPSSRNERYPHASILKRKCYVHRIAFLWMTGEWPKHQVDHINGNSLDNRWANLRDVPHSHNQQNRKAAKKGKALPLGVIKADARFNACITIDGRRMLIGRYDSPESAHRAYLRVKRAVHPGCTI